MDPEAGLADALASLARGATTETSYDGSPDAAAAALEAVACFWRGDYGLASQRAALALDAATEDRTRALACAAVALAAAGDLAADAADADDQWAVGLALVVAAPEPESRWWSAVRYLLAESALVSARLDDAGRAIAAGPPTADAWEGHPFAAMMRACDVRVAAFAGDIDRASTLLEPMRASVVRGNRLGMVVEAVAGLVLGNADDAGGVQRSIAVADARLDVAERDFVDRGVLLLLAFGAIAVGDAAGAGRLVFRAGDDGDLASCTIIDRALGFELFVVAALAEDDLAAAQAWVAVSAPLAVHPIAAPTMQRARARYLLAIGDVEAALAAVQESIAGCRRTGRAVEAAEGEIVLARARIAARDVAGASRDLRALVSASDAAGHHAVRRSAASALQPARRRLRPVAGAGWSVLSEREQEVARCVLEGMEVEEIATGLFLSVGTVRTHLSRVLCAFGVATRIGLLAVAGPQRSDVVAVPERLSPRQAEVVRLVASGATNQQIADLLGISVKGVEKHVRDVLARWRVGSRFEIARVWWGSDEARAPGSALSE